MAATDATKTYTGGCHCGFLRYSAKLDLTDPRSTKCNCSLCLKLNTLSLKVVPPSHFTLQSPSSTDNSLLGNYTHGGKSIRYHFCKTCGVSCFSEGKYTFDGKEVEVLGINAVTLDPDQGIDLREFKVQYWDGKGNNWAAGLKDVPYPGGCY